MMVHTTRSTRYTRQECTIYLEQVYGEILQHILIVRRPFLPSLLALLLRALGLATATILGFDRAVVVDRPAENTDQNGHLPLRQRRAHEALVKIGPISGFLVVVSVLEQTADHGFPVLQDLTLDVQCERVAVSAMV